MDPQAKVIKDAQRGFDREIGKARAKRQKAFALAQRQGFPLTEIARIVGLSEAHIEDIIDGN